MSMFNIKHLLNKHVKLHPQTCICLKLNKPRLYFQSSHNLRAQAIFETTTQRLTAFGGFNTGARSGAGLYLFVLVRSMWPLSTGARLSSGVNETSSCASDIWSQASALRCRDRSHWGPVWQCYWYNRLIHLHGDICSERLVFRHLLNIRIVLELNCGPRLVQVEFLDAICGKIAV